jgi:hypothetical protein
LNVTALGAVFYIFHKHGGILHSWISFAITALIESQQCVFRINAGFCSVMHGISTTYLEGHRLKNLANNGIIGQC